MINSIQPKQKWNYKRIPKVEFQDGTYYLEFWWKIPMEFLALLGISQERKESWKIKSFFSFGPSNNLKNGWDQFHPKEFWKGRFQSNK